MSEEAVTSLVQTALAMGKSENALAALDAYPNSNVKPALLLLRAQAREKLAAAKGGKALDCRRGLSRSLFSLSSERRSKNCGTTGLLHCNRCWANNSPAPLCRRR